MKMDTPTRAPAPRARKAKPAPRWDGALEGMADGTVYGWAIDRERPDARVVVEICLNGECISTVSADVARTDLAEAFGTLDICHGFAADLGGPIGSRGVLSARIANTDVALPGTISVEAPVKPGIGATSAVLGDGGLRLHGWALDTSRSDRPVTVSAYCGSRLLAQARADRVLASLRNYVEGPYCFTLDLPPDLADGAVHTVRLIDELGQQLNGSPVTVCTPAVGATALLPADAPRLLHDVLDDYERRIPRSLGFAYYDSWNTQFESDAPTTDSGLAVGVLIAGADGAAVARTLASIAHQSHVRVQTYVRQGRVEPFKAQLAAALASNVDVLTCLRAGDVLVPNALTRALEGFASDGAQLVYTDSEHQGRPWFKPAWNHDYAYATDYPLDLMLVRLAALRSVVAHADNPANFAWSALGAAMGSDDAIVHIPRVLVRSHAPLDAAERADRLRACADVLAGREPAAKLVPLDSTPAESPFGARRVVRALSKKERARKVSLIIPTRDCVELLERCISTLQEHTRWPGLELLVIDNGSVEKKTKAYFKAIAKNGVRVLPMPGPFNFADLNNRAVYEAEGDIVGLINNDIEAMHDGWLDEIIGQLLRPGVGAVGAKLLWPNGMVQHGGVVLGVRAAAGHYGNLLADGDWGNFGRNQLTHQVSAVTGACLFVRKSDYLRVGGMDPVGFPVAFNDVDLCLRLRAAGLAITWTAHAKLLHAESASRGQEDSPQKLSRFKRELDLLRERWRDRLLRDPAYHPSLNLDLHSQPFGGLALPPRDRSPRTGRFD
ncbi:MAG: glycosyltransferase family 2 protein [Telluria sp.]